MNGDQPVKQFLWGSLFIMLFVTSLSEAAIKVPSSIKCETPFGEKAFEITEDQVQFLKETDKSRDIASVKKIRTRLTLKGFEKTLYHQGLKHEVHIEDFENFSDVDDYVTVTSSKGHKMTYPLTCQL